ncbi:hypothetical protein C922_05275 [Plasmodium inui San Antonio 1]|uniref:Tryptophan/threonine-rich plasmodium antigen C-terminal domain-containing protein n=1 Tax=Plasmodium inui San Antonio 1 TaxID=1237626 RepID=W7AG96_9APIC|nr:hypothetical protein C922_05275 [Plasmodium inui San Antonio 1]EUD64336.1 hypothetical protein C922_05275 [Plasmodium inui San Antonio 1]
METLSNYEQLMPETLSSSLLPEEDAYSSLSSYGNLNPQFLTTARNRIRRSSRNAIVSNTVQQETVEKDGKESPSKSASKTESTETNAENNNQKNEANQSNQSKKLNDNNIKRINESAEKRKHRYNTGLEADKAEVQTVESAADGKRSQTSLLDKIIRTNKIGKEGMKKLIKKQTVLHTGDYNDKDSTDDLQGQKSEEWKNKQWNIWKKKNETEWKVFNTCIENEKDNWLQRVEQEWQQFLEAMQNKWIHINKRMDEEYKIIIPEESAAWDDTQWIEWIKTEGREFMEHQWKIWLSQKEADLNDWIVKQWIGWKNSQISDWLMTDWRLQEEASWSNYENHKITNMLQRKKRKKWTEWRERINREREEWEDWVRSKENIYLNSKWNKWSKWKRDKRFIFSKWVEMITNRLINERQWKEWVKS